ncbi:tetratricopeptide (TPR) repeat protein [Pelomonas saccharophila]|uniref:Tetratricopeptide (TPR) repeat protein n=1 Tax=Roseateles saccharophilus TaxID=304 RepID=A0ABU1YJR1_ROSSA|nr:tetratricopeptide repeat protein [Roseateles saccharophilus]MDR7269087.1 tetratricopeptide (TPR) repeat protein [Roseateles saccharophilus]
MLAVTCIAITVAAAAEPARVPADALQHWNAAGIRASQFDWGGAIIEINAVIALLPNEPAALNFRGDMHLRMQNWAQAEADYSRAIELYGANKQAAQSLIRRSTIWTRSRPDDSLKDIERAVRLDPDYAEARYMHAAALWQRGLNKDALEEINKGIALDPDKGLYHQMRGMVLERLGDLASAKAALDIGVQREPSMFMTWSARASLGLKLGDFVSARDDANKALSLFPSARGMRVTVAIATALLGDIVAANAMFLEIAAQTPEALSPQARVAGLEIDAVLERIGRNDVNGARAELAWGLVCKARGEKDDAKRHFAEALRRDPSTHSEVEIARAEARR